MDSLSPLLSTTLAVFADLKRNLHILRWRYCKFNCPSFALERNALETVKKAPAASAPARALIRLYTLCFMVTPPLRRFFFTSRSYHSSYTYCFMDISPPSRPSLRARYTRISGEIPPCFAGCAAQSWYTFQIGRASCRERV